MNRLKKLVKQIVPFAPFSIYQRFKLYNWRLCIVENELKNAWLLNRTPVIKDQKEMLRRKEFQIYSQTGEDGIIDYIFEKIGTKNKQFIEIGIEDGKQCNTANLSLNFGWRGTAIEGNPDYAEKAKRYYESKPVKVINAFVTRENINALIKKAEVKKNIDLLSIDIDGNDYWIWEAIKTIEPRVVVIEYNSILGHDPLTIPYNPKFEQFKAHSSGFYYGASLSALNKLANSKGYILVGCTTWGLNAFFVKKEDARGSFVSLLPNEADYLPNGESKTKKSFSLIKHMPFTRV